MKPSNKPKGVKGGNGKGGKDGPKLRIAEEKEIQDPIDVPIEHKESSELTLGDSLVQPEPTNEVPTGPPIIDDVGSVPPVEEPTETNEAVGTDIADTTETEEKQEQEQGEEQEEPQEPEEIEEQEEIEEPEDVTAKVEAEEVPVEIDPKNDVDELIPTIGTPDDLLPTSEVTKADLDTSKDEDVEEAVDTVNKVVKEAQRRKKNKKLPASKKDKGKSRGKHHNKRPLIVKVTVLENDGKKPSVRLG